MATRRSDNYKSAAWGWCLTCLVLTAAVAVHPAARTPAPRPSADAQTQEARDAIAGLARALDQCRDESAARYLRYRLGIVQFKAGLLTEAAAAFEPLARDTRAPELLRACSLNMAGQVARLLGEYGPALQAFANLADLAEKGPTLAPQDRARPALHMLWQAALISRAEILEAQKNLAAAAAEYERVLQLAKDRPVDEGQNSQIPLVMDRLSQLCLQTQDTGRYLGLTADLLARFPAYPRVPMVEMERVCVQALQNAPPARECPPGVLYAPARFIADLRRTGAAGPAAEALNSIERLCGKYEGTPLGTLLDYDYAWMLDAAGRRDPALEVLARIAAPSEPPGTAAPEAAPSQADILRRYAALQRVLLLAERKDYDKALEVLAGLPPAPDPKSHVALLAESMTRNVQTLKREVPPNASHSKN